MVVKKIDEKPGETNHEEVTVDGGVTYIDVDTESEQGQLILALLTELEQRDAEIAEAGTTRLVFRSSNGAEASVPLPVREPGQTELVLIGVPRADDLGRWDLAQEEFRFVWENPAARPPKLPKCMVTGDGCVHIHEDGYCNHCPGLTPAFREAHGLSDTSEEL